MDNTEVWRPIPEFTGLYEASNTGRIRSVDRIVPHRNGPTRRKGKVMRSSLVGRYRDYLGLILCKEGKQHNRKVHLLVASAWLGPRPEGMVVNHMDGDKLNNAADNLEYVTQKENVRHSWDNGMSTPNFGEKHGCSKLTEGQVKEIRSIEGMRQRDIAKLYGISQATVWQVRSGKTWGCVAR